MTDEPLDVALLIPAWSKVQDWKDLSHVYVHQRPLATGPGARVWLCKDRRLVYSYRIDDFLDLRDHEEEGWAFVVSDGRRANRGIDDIPDPHDVVKRWMQGFRYMRAGAGEFVRAPRQPRRPKPVEAEQSQPASQETKAVAAQPTPSPPSWARRAARLLARRK